MFIKRLGTLVLALSLAVFGVSCSNSLSETVGPDGELDRSAPPGEVEEPTALDCSASPVNVFSSGGGLPFTLSCESMANAVVESLNETFNATGCLVGLDGVVSFTDSGNRYEFDAQVNGCWQDGGTLSVCSLGARDCIRAQFPAVTSTEGSNLPESK